MRRLIFGLPVGLALLAAATGVEAQSSAAAQPAHVMTCTKDLTQDPDFRVRDLKISGTAIVTWTPKSLAQGMSPQAKGFVKCNVAAELAVNAAFLWGEQGANVPASDVTSGIGPKGHKNIAWTSAGWTHHTGGSVKNKKVFWTFHQKGTSATVTFELDCANVRCSAV